MFRCVFIGDDLTAAGFRLAGARVYRTPPREAAALLDRLADPDDPSAELILMTPEVAEALPAGRLSALQQAGWPLVLVIPDVRGRRAPPDLVSSLRRHLGLGE